MMDALRRNYNRSLPLLVCILAAVFYGYEYLLRIAPSVMTDELRDAFDIDAGPLGTLIACYYFAYAPMQLPVGILMDRFGPRRLLFIASLCCGIGSLLFANPSHDILTASIGRFMVGFGSAFAFVGVLKLATIWMPAERFAFISGLTVSLAMIGNMNGNAVIGAYTRTHGWHSTVVFSGYVGIILAIVIFMVVRDYKDAAKAAKKMSGKTIVSVFMDFARLLDNPYIWLNGAIGMLLYVPLSAVAELMGIDYIQNTFEVPKETALTINNMIFLGWGIGPPFFGWLSDRIKNRKKILMCGSFVALAASLSIYYLSDLGVWELRLLFLILGLGSSAQVLVFSVARSLFPKRLSGSAIALTNMFVMFSGVIFQPLISSLLDVHWSKFTMIAADGNRIYSGADYHYAMFILPVSMVLAALLSIFIIDNYQEE